MGQDYGNYSKAMLELDCQEKAGQKLTRLKGAKHDQTIN